MDNDVLGLAPLGAAQLGDLIPELDRALVAVAEGIQSPAANGKPGKVRVDLTLETPESGGVRISWAIRQTIPREAEGAVYALRSGDGLALPKAHQAELPLDNVTPLLRGDKEV